MLPQKIVKFRCLEMLFSMFSRQYLGLKNNQNYEYINHIVCLLRITTVLFLKISTTGFGADAILAHAKAWDLVLWKCPRRSTTLRSRWSLGFNFLYFHRKVNTFKTPEMCPYLDSDVWAGCFTTFVRDLFIILSRFRAEKCRRRSTTLRSISIARGKGKQV